MTSSSGGDSCELKAEFHSSVSRTGVDGR